VDRAVRKQLVRSIKTVYGRARSFVAADQTAVRNLIRDISRHPARPAAFGAYTELVESISAGDADAAQYASDQLLALNAPCPNTRIVTLTDDDLGPGHTERYSRLINDDPEQAIYVKPLDDKTAAASAVREALAFIEASAPSLAEEIRTLAREIIMVESGASSETGEVSQFDGASTFYLWGAVFTRVANKTPAELAQTLAHETGHLLLFGLMMGRPLVENTEDERYDSPLRQDARPMEGVVHAAYVVARMHYALSSILQAGLLPADGATQAQTQLLDYHRLFFDSLSTIEHYARFTPQGADVFRNAVDYMKSARVSGVDH
jgi:hypothetical protein